MVKKLEAVPLAGGLVKSLNEKSKVMGFQRTMKEILRLTDSKLKVVNKRRELKLIFKNDPVIVVSNHPAMTDVVVLIAAQDRRNQSYLIISSNFLGILPNLDKHLIPVYVNHRLLDKSDKFNFLMKMFRKIHWTENYSKAVSHQKNIDSIKRAGKIVRNGGMVSMFPGGGGQRGEWFPGIGYLIRESISNQKTKIVMAFIEGTSTWDYLKLIPGVGIFMPKPKVTFSTEESIAIYNNMEPKTIAINLKNKYDLWVESLPKQDKWWEKVINKIPSIPENAYYLTRCLVLWVMTRTMS